MIWVRWRWLMQDYGSKWLASISSRRSVFFVQSTIYHCWRSTEKVRSGPDCRSRGHGCSSPQSYRRPSIYCLRYFNNINHDEPSLVRDVSAYRAQLCATVHVDHHVQFTCYWVVISLPASFVIASEPISFQYFKVTFVQQNLIRCIISLWDAKCNVILKTSVN